MLTDQEMLRYSRHLLLDDIGQQGQEKIKAARVLIVGMGGLGCPVAQYLTAAGVGTLLLADGDQLELSNLQRQTLYTHEGIGEDKVDLAQASLQGLNDEVVIEAIPERLDAAALSDLVPQVDLVLDCTDNLPSRQQINRACHQFRVPLISAAAIRFEGQLCAFDYANDASPCYHCLYPESSEAPRLNCSNSGVVSPVLGVMGSVQALEAIKFIIGLPISSLNELRIFDAKSLQWQSFFISKNSRCSVCTNSSDLLVSR